MSATATALWDWTPYLAGGFGRNLMIATLAMAMGSIGGVALGWLHGRGRLPRLLAAAATGVCRNVPSFVLMFYVAFLLPVEIARAGVVVTVPLWIKATLALTIPVLGFASDQYRGFRRQSEAGMPGAGATTLTAWLQYFLIILMASSTASVIGADEIVGRANRVIATDQRPEFLIATYVYVSLWFLAAGAALSVAAPRLVRLAIGTFAPRRHRQHATGAAANPY
jgi:ABC-type amino acid transport system permease subunit